DRNGEIFFYDTSTGSFTQVTNTTTLNDLFPSISGDGTRIAFVSDSDLIGGNADHNFEIFLYDAATNSLTQVTNTTGSNGPPSINAEGTLIAFSSDHNLIVGGNG